jgi:hypothetical protein
MERRRLLERRFFKARRRLLERRLDDRKLRRLLRARLLDDRRLLRRRLMAERRLLRCTLAEAPSFCSLLATTTGIPL